MSIFKRNEDPPYNVRSPVMNPPQPAEKAAATPPSATWRPATPSTTAPTQPTATSTPDAASTSASDLRRIAAILDKNTEITGTLHSDGNVLVEGIFHGEIAAHETVWVEKGAQSQGQLRANDVVISGSVDGEITCENRLQIAASAIVTGEIRTPVLVIEEGATINCRFKMEPIGRNTK